MQMMSSSTNSSYSTISTQSSSLWSDIQTEDDTGSLGSLDSTDSALSSRSRGRSKVRRQWEKGERSQRADSSASEDRSRRTSRNRSRSMSRFGGRDRSRSAPPATQPTVILSPSNRADELEIDEDIQSLMDRFVHNTQKASLRSREWNTRFPPNAIIVYTDGSMVGNYHLSGIGIFHAPHSKLNKSQRILGAEHNSGLAELVAAREALRDILGFEGFHGQRVIVRSDYLGLIDAMQSPAYEGRFAAVVNEIKRMCERGFPAGVTFEHVYAHSEDVGNELADRLARVATRRDRNRSRSRVRPVRWIDNALARTTPSSFGDTAPLSDAQIATPFLSQFTQKKHPQIYTINNKFITDP
ncbi:hypothetical protein WR25_03742 [Diploscapter pachys]|uniref:ribonuclease H n=1 Tax=Diploscapter pachys TaxID=2018661 RepID=A0A2A2LN80_9BILA|nr:hypothetical protein WR25_03742 [Diploscapter pachys]